MVATWPGTAGASADPWAGSTLSPAPVEPVRLPHRDLRLDFFRGLALLFIFLDHIPSNLVNWITVQKYGFSDAAEIFIFLSGYAAAIAYGSAMRRSGFWFASARILRRCWELYAAQILLFVMFTAQVAYAGMRFHNSMFAEETAVAGFLQNPPVILMQALVLKFRPANLDILPLYILLLLAFPLVLWLLERWPAWVFGASLLLYGFVQARRVNLAAYPPGSSWFFNPFAWQFLFVIGALLGRRHGRPRRVWPLQSPLLALSSAYLGFAFLVTLTWHVPSLESLVPPWLGALLYPISKTDLSPWRLIHFLALAHVTVSLLGQRPRFLEWRVARPVIRCGQQSLHIFCAGVLLSFAAHVVLVEVDGAFGMQLLVSLIGVGLMISLAYLLGWYRRTDRAANAAQ